MKKKKKKKKKRRRRRRGGGGGGSTSATRNTYTCGRILIILHWKFWQLLFSNFRFIVQIRVMCLLCPFIHCCGEAYIGVNNKQESKNLWMATPRKYPDQLLARIKQNFKITVFKERTIEYKTYSQSNFNDLGIILAVEDRCFIWWNQNMWHL